MIDVRRRAGIFAPFERFADIVRALNEAGVRYVAEGGWFRCHYSWGPPLWEGMLIVPCSQETVLRLLAAFDAAGYAPQFPVSPEIYADPANLPGRDVEFDDDDPEDTGFIKFLPVLAPGTRVAVSSGQTPGGDLIEVMVVTPDGFAAAYELCFIDEVAPGVPVRVPENAITRSRPLERLCPQIIRDVAVLDATWREELLPAGHAVDGSALPGTDTAGGTAPPIEAGVSLPRFHNLVGALVHHGVAHVLAGGCRLDTQYEPARFWDGHIGIPLRRQEAGKAFGALAQAGYVPAQPISPEEFLDPARRIHWIDEHPHAARERERILTFIDPSPGLARVQLVGVSEEVFAAHLERASLKRVAAGVNAVMLDSSLRGERYRGGGAPGSEAEWLERWLCADGGAAPLDAELAAQLLPFPEFTRVAKALSGAGIVFLADGNWHRHDAAQGRPRWEGYFVLPGEPVIMLRSLATLEGLGYRPQDPVDPHDFAHPGNRPGLDDGFEDDEDTDYAVITLLPEQPGAAPIRLEVESLQEFMEEFRNGRRERVSPELWVSLPEISWIDYPYQADFERHCPQSLPLVASLDLLCRGAGEDVEGDAAEPELASALRAQPPPPAPSFWAALLAMPPRWPHGRQPGRKGLSLELYECLVHAMNRTGIPYVLEGGWFIDDERLSILWDGDLTIAQDARTAQAAFTALASLDLAPHPAMSAHDFAIWPPEPRWTDDPRDTKPVPVLRFFKQTDPTSRVHLVAISSLFFDNACDLAAIEELAPDMPVLVRNIVNDGLAYSSCPQRLKQVRMLEAKVREVVGRGE